MPSGCLSHICRELRVHRVHPLCAFESGKSRFQDTSRHPRNLPISRLLGYDFPSLHVVVQTLVVGTNGNVKPLKPGKNHTLKVLLLEAVFMKWVIQGVVSASDMQIQQVLMILHQILQIPQGTVRGIRIIFSHGPKNTQKTLVLKYSIFEDLPAQICATW